MGDNYVDAYKKDKEIIVFEFKYETINWWKKQIKPTKKLI
jgi:hypothetical protein